MSNLRDLKEGVKEAFFFIGLALKSLVFWRREPDIVTVKDLIRFVETRSKYVSQRTLFGYVKTRAGTRYTLLFEDKTFSNSVNISKWEIYLAALSDLSIHAAARVFNPASDQVDQAKGLAGRLFNTVLEHEEIPDERPQGFDDVRATFEKRLSETNWQEAVAGESVFQNSIDALVRWAPVADELKKYDIEPVRNSLRFEWKRVRDELVSILDIEAVRGEL